MAKKNKKNQDSQPSNGVGSTVGDIPIPMTVNEALQRFGITSCQILKDQIPKDANGKISIERPFWNFRLNELYFVNGNEVFHAKIPSENAQDFLEMFVKIPRIYVPSRILNRVPDDKLTDEQRKRKRDRNEERRYQA